VTIRPASDRSLLISFGGEISADAHRQVVRLTHALEGARGILNLHPAFASVLIDFDPRRHTHSQIEAMARERFEAAASREPSPPRTVEIPVEFGRDAGPDLEDVAQHAGASPERVVEIFAAAEYEVWFVGFSTCFPYLGGLPPELATPRLGAPRKVVPAGSVAVGGAQAGVYPLPSPGGWRIVGRTRLRLFDPAGEPPGLLRMGDRVRFVPL
jgi:KipI family sensor histidine kinase inhibitor